MTKSFPLQDALAISFAAFRLRGGYVKDTRRYSEDKPTEHSNKDMVKQHFGPYKDPDFVDFKANEEDYEGVEIAQKHFRKYTMQLLGDDMTDFQKDVFAVLQMDQVPFAKLGLLAFIPKLVEREIEESKFKKLLTFSNSCILVTTLIDISPFIYLFSTPQYKTKVSPSNIPPHPRTSSSI